jgi:large repetitive protein
VKVSAGQGNSSADPLFVNPIGVTAELTVSGSRLDPQVAAVTLTGGDPPVGLTSNYHIQLPAAPILARLLAAAASQVIDRGVRCSNTPVPAPVAAAITACTGGGIQAPLGTTGADIDNGARPIFMTLRLNTPWDRGADESTILP